MVRDQLSVLSAFRGSNPWLRADEIAILPSIPTLTDTMLVTLVRALD
jgi:hypothetical protein